VLHSCAPSQLRYPDTRAERLAGPVVFSAPLKGDIWRCIRRLVRSDWGLRLMMGRLECDLLRRRRAAADHRSDERPTSSGMTLGTGPSASRLRAEA